MVEENSNERIKWVNDIRYNNLSAKELLSYKENKDKDTFESWYNN